MSGFADLVDQAQPALLGDGCFASGSAGSTWRWTFDGIVDNAGDPVDLTTATGTCKIVTAPGGSDVLALTFAGALGSFTLTADESLTAGLFTGSDNTNGRVCYWYLHLVSGGDRVQVWMVDNSKFQIRRGA